MLPLSAFAGTVSFNSQEDLLATLIVCGFFLALALMFYLYGIFRNLSWLDLDIDLEDAIYTL